MEGVLLENKVFSRGAYVAERNGIVAPSVVVVGDDLGSRIVIN